MGGLRLVRAPARGNLGAGQRPRPYNRSHPYQHRIPDLRSSRCRGGTRAHGEGYRRPDWAVLVESPSVLNRVCPHTPKDTPGKPRQDWGHTRGYQPRHPATLTRVSRRILGRSLRRSQDGGHTRGYQPRHPVPLTLPAMRRQEGLPRSYPPPLMVHGAIRQLPSTFASASSPQPGKGGRHENRPPPYEGSPPPLVARRPHSHAMKLTAIACHEVHCTAVYRFRWPSLTTVLR